MFAEYLELYSEDIPLHNVHLKAFALMHDSEAGIIKPTPRTPH